MGGATLELPDELPGSKVLQLLFSAAGYALLVVLFVALIYSGLRPLGLERFQASDVLYSRLFLALAPLPVGIFLIAIGVSRRYFTSHIFTLRVPHLMSLRLNWLLIATLLVCGLLLLLDPFGVYASARSKAIIKVYYVTDRQPLRDVGFSSEPSNPETISYGMAEVPVVWGHKDVGWDSVTSFEWERNDPVPVRLFNLDAGGFFDGIVVDAYNTPRHEAFMFVHGFHNPFDEALEKTAKLAYDLKFGTNHKLGGVSILYSWPSGDDSTSYDHDYESALWSVEDLKEVLVKLTDPKIGLEHLQLLAHSMGTRVLVGAVKSMGKPANSKPIADNIVLAAADLDEPIFDQVSPALRASADRITLYVSAWDGALAASSALHKGLRVGLLPVRHDGIDVIDTRGMDTSIKNLKHSYLFDSQPVWTDLFYLLRDDIPPDRRVGLVPTQDKCCWEFERR